MSGMSKADRQQASRSPAQKPAGRKTSPLAQANAATPLGQWAETIRTSPVMQARVAATKNAFGAALEPLPIIQRATINPTGLPDTLKANVEAMSGFAMNDVRVHYNSSKPAQLQALAYAQGTDIHLAPGQQKHLPHEAWHVVQQKQGRVKPTLQMEGVAINNDDMLEAEADRSAKRQHTNAHQSQASNESAGALFKTPHTMTNNVIQRYTEAKLPTNESGKISENGLYVTSKASHVYVKPGSKVERSLPTKKSLKIDEINYEIWTPEFKVIPDCVGSAEELMHGKKLKHGVPKASVFKSKDEKQRPFGESDAENKKFGKQTNQNTKANPNVLDAYVVVRQRSIDEVRSPYHGATVVAKDGSDNVTLETFAPPKESANRVLSNYDMYGKGKQSFATYWRKQYFGVGASVSVLNKGALPADAEQPKSGKLKNKVVAYEEKGTQATSFLPQLPAAQTASPAASTYQEDFQNPATRTPPKSQKASRPAKTAAGNLTTYQVAYSPPKDKLPNIYFTRSKAHAAQKASPVTQAMAAMPLGQWAETIRTSPVMQARSAAIKGAFGLALDSQPVIQRAAAPNRTGLPDALKANVEAMSGLAMDDVRVHYNSSKPAQLRALAYAQGTEIHLAPGQEKHLPHEAWHVVQQKQGRVKPTLQMKGVAINDDSALEREADQHGDAAGRKPQTVQHASSTTELLSRGSDARLADSGAIQAKGFLSVNDKTTGYDQNEAIFAAAGLEAWDSVFSDDAIDKKGGIVGGLVHQQDKEIDAEAKTRFEETIPQDAFAFVSAKGDVNKGTSIPRWTKQSVVDEAVLTTETLKAKENEIKMAILALLNEGQNEQAQSEEGEEDNTFEPLLDFDGQEISLPSFYANHKQKGPSIVEYIYDLLRDKLPTRKNTLTPSLFWECCPEKDKATPALLFHKIIAAAGVSGIANDRYEPKEVAMPLSEVLMHEFGHVKAFLDGGAADITPNHIASAKKTVAAALQKPTDKLVNKTGLELIEIARHIAENLKDKVVKGLDRNELTRYRFLWAGIVTDWCKVKDLEASSDHVRRSKTIMFMQNVLMSLEEYKNIQDIDNAKAAGKSSGIRLSHGTESATAAQLGYRLDLDDVARQIKFSTMNASPIEVSEAIWQEKMKILLEQFISTCE